MTIPKGATHKVNYETIGGQIRYYRKLNGVWEYWDYDLSEWAKSGNPDSWYKDHLKKINTFRGNV